MDPHPLQTPNLRPGPASRRRQERRRSGRAKVLRFAVQHGQGRRQVSGIWTEERTDEEGGAGEVVALSGDADRRDDDG